MASIASVYVDVLPSTGRIAAGIEKALRDVDVRKVAREWKRDIDRELGRTEVEVTADTAKPKRDLDKLERERHTAHVKVEVDQAA